MNNYELYKIVIDEVARCAKHFESVVQEHTCLDDVLKCEGAMLNEFSVMLGLSHKNLLKRLKRHTQECTYKDNNSIHRHIAWGLVKDRFDTHWRLKERVKGGNK